MNRKPMEFESLVIGALSVLLILGMDVPKEHLKSIYP